MRKTLWVSSTLSSFAERFLTATLISAVIAFQFSRIGNDEGAKLFLEGLDKHPEVGRYVAVETGMASSARVKSPVASSYAVLIII
jgi:hypothetical protein